VLGHFIDYTFFDSVESIISKEESNVLSAALGVKSQQQMKLETR